MNGDTRIAFLFPGQGSQRPGMLSRLRSDRIGAELLAEASALLGRDALDLDGAEAQSGTWAAQLGLLIVGVASARQLAHERLVCDFVAGHSVGAFAAAVHAQCLTFAEAIRLVDLRARLMAQAHPHGYGMAAVAGVPEQTLREWIDAARTRGATLHLANRNAARQFTVSGADADLEALVAHARANGAGKALRLAVATPSHSALMADVAARMREALRGVQLDDARIPFATNRRARIEIDGRSIAEDLATGVAHPVQWHEISRALYERGVRVFVEMAPGVVLSSLARSEFGDAQVFALEQRDARELALVLEAHRRPAD